MAALKSVMRGAIFFVLFHFSGCCAQSMQTLTEVHPSLDMRKNAALQAAQVTPYRNLTQYEEVVEALRAASGRYGAFAGVLDSLPTTSIRKGITIFAPNDAALTGFGNLTAKDVSQTIDVHTITEQLPFSSLLRLEVGAKLLTAANITIVVTSTAPNSYKLNNAIIVDPDLYTDATIAVHGINAVFNTSEFGMEPIPGLIPTPSFFPPNLARKNTESVPIILFFVAVVLLWLF